MATLAPITKLIAKGAWGTVECAVRPGGSCPTEEFLAAMTKVARARFEVLFQQMANYGSVSPKRLKKEMGKLSAFRHEIDNRQIRFPCFQDGKRWIITHGFYKPGAQKGMGEWPASEIERAQEIETECRTRLKKPRGNK